MNRLFVVTASAILTILPQISFSETKLPPFEMQTSPSDMTQVVEVTIANHPDLLRAKNERSAAAKDIRQAWGNYLPQVDVSGGVGKERSDNPATRATGNGEDTLLTRKETDVRVRQLLYDGGETASRVLQRKFDYSTTNFQVSETAEKLAFDAVKAYLDVMRTRELVDVARSDVKSHQVALVKVDKRLQAGAGRKDEVSLVKSRLALAQSRLEQAMGDLDDANDSFKVVVGVPSVPRDLRLPAMPINIPRSLIDAQLIAMQVSPTIAAFNAQYEASIASVDLAKSTYFPVITLELGDSLNNNLDGVKGHNDTAEAMLRLRYNVYRGGSDQAAISAAQSRKLAARYDTDNARREIGRNVAFSWNELQTSKDDIPFLKAHKVDSLEVFDAYQKQFLLGQRTLFDLLNAQTEYFDASRNLVNGRYNFYTSHFRLLSDMGILLKTLTGLEEKDNYYAFANRKTGVLMTGEPGEVMKDPKLVIVKVATQDNAKNVKANKSDTKTAKANMNNHSKQMKKSAQYKQQPVAKQQSVNNPNPAAEGKSMTQSTSMAQPQPAAATENKTVTQPTSTAQPQPAAATENKTVTQPTSTAQPQPAVATENKTVTQPTSTAQPQPAAATENKTVTQPTSTAQPQPAAATENKTVTQPSSTTQQVSQSTTDQKNSASKRI